MPYCTFQELYLSKLTELSSSILISPFLPSPQINHIPRGTRNLRRIPETFDHRQSNNRSIRTIEQFPKIRRQPSKINSRTQAPRSHSIFASSILLHFTSSLTYIFLSWGRHSPSQTQVRHPSRYPLPELLQHLLPLLPLRGKLLAVLNSH